MKTKQVINLVVLTVTFLLICCAGISQNTPKIMWYVEKVDSKSFQVDVISDINIDNVTFSVVVKLPSGGTKRIDIQLTDAELPVLKGNTGYSRIFDLDFQITGVEGISMTGEETTGKSDTIAGEATVTPSQQKMEQGNRDWITVGKKKEQRNVQQLKQPARSVEDKPTSAMEKSKVPVQKAAVPCLESKFKDLTEWLRASNSNVIQVQVTFVNEPLADGNYYYSAWGTSTFQTGPDSENACLLTTRPPVKMLFSDRKTTQAEVGSELNMQPFAIGKNDVTIITLDLAKGIILSKSVTWNFETTYTQITRTGNIIYGVKDGSMIILNLLKTQSGKK